MGGGSGGTPPEHFGSLHALKCVLGPSEAPFCACIQYINLLLIRKNSASYTTAIAVRM